MLPLCKSSLPSSVQHTDNIYSMAGGTMMVLIGVLYLVFEKKLLAKTVLPGDSATPADDTLSRSLIGVQV